MSKKPQGADNDTLSTVVPVRLRDEVDEVRGRVPRSRWIRIAMENELARIRAAKRAARRA